MITNAFEAIERNHEHDKKVRMFVTDIGEEILIEVEDSGQGVHDEIITSIFYKVFNESGGKTWIWISESERVSGRFKWKYCD